jgi:hypothetical protein
MKRRPIIGLFISGIVLSILFGIASLPDEVLIQSSSVENSKIDSEEIQNVPTLEEVSDSVTESMFEKKIEKTNAELSALKMELDQLKTELNQLKAASIIPEDISEISEVEDEKIVEQSEGRVFTVKLNSGVGAGYN